MDRISPSRPGSASAAATLWLAPLAAAQSWSLDLAVGDVDCDGTDEVVVAWPHEVRPLGWGTVQVVDGESGALRWRVDGDYELGPTGLGVAVITRDVSEPLIAIATHIERTQELAIELRRGRDGTRLVTWRLPSTTREFDCTLVPLGDVDGDGVCDLALSRPWFVAPNGGRGRISIHSLLDGCQLAAREATGERARWSGRLVAGRFDIERELELLAVESDGRDWRFVRLTVPELDTRTLDAPSEPGWRLGGSFVNAGDFDGDGRDEVAVALTRSASDPELWGADHDGRVVVGSTGGTPWRVAAELDGIAHYGPFLARLVDDDGDVCIAAGTPWARTYAGIWRVFALDGQELASWRSEHQTYYAVELAACRVRGERASRLIVVTESQDADAGFARQCAGLECWGGARWAQMRWNYKVEPDASYMP